MLSGQALGVSDESLEIEEIQKGGSERRFFRLRTPELEENLILLEYAQGREENNYYAPIAAFLEECGVPAPRLRGQNEPERLVWMEDLGTVDLHDLSGGEWPKRRALYEKVLEGIRPLHDRQARQAAADRGIPMMPPFDAASYRWERDYFRKHCLGSIHGHTLPDHHWDRVDGELAASAAFLLELPEVLVHRDFQSQNIMVTGEALDRVGFIDFQGMRPGAAVYDLASLIEDPYARLTAGERKDLTALIGKATDPEMLKRAAVQRLMQALGAYGNLGIVLGKTWFLQHIPFAEARLRELAGELGLSGLQDLLDGVAAAKRG